MDGRRLDGYTISSPCEPNGSGELKRKKKTQTNAQYYYNNVHTLGDLHIT